MVLRSAIAIAIAIALPGAASAQSKLRVAVYAPWSGPSTADDRHALSLAIESAVKSGGVDDVDVSTYAKLSDFRRQIARSAVDIAVVDSAALSVLGKSMKIEASWSSGEAWILAGAKKLDSIANRTLALQARDASTSKRFVSRLLRGQVDAKFWKSIVGAPVTADARELVARGKADVVVLPVSKSGGLESLIELGSFSELVIAARRKNAGSAAARKRVQAAVQKQLGGSWAAGKPKLPADPTPKRLVPAFPEDARLTILPLLKTPDVQLRKFSATDMWIEPDAPKIAK